MILWFAISRRGRSRWRFGVAQPIEDNNEVAPRRETLVRSSERAVGVCRVWGLAKFDLYEDSGLKPSPRTMRESLSRGTMKAHEASPERESRDGASCRLANETAKFSREEEPNERRTTNDGRA